MTSCDAIVRQRRRVILLAVCAALAGSLLFADPWIALGAGAAALAAGAALVALVPPWRRLCEVGGLAILATGLLPAPAPMLPGLFLLFAAAAHVLLYGRWSDHRALRLTLVTRLRGTLRSRPARVWALQVPGAAPPGEPGATGIFDHHADPEDPETVHMRLRTPDGLFEEASASFIERDPPHRCRYFFERHAGAGPEQSEVTLALTPVPGGCAVEKTVRQLHLPPRIALARWFDRDAGLGLETCEVATDWALPGLRRRRGSRQPQRPRTGRTA